MQSSISKIKAFLSSPENILTGSLSTLLALMMLFFVERKSVDPRVILFENNSIFYLLMLLLLLALCGSVVFYQKKKFKPSDFLKKIMLALIPTELSLTLGLFVFNYETHASIIFYLFAFLFPATIILYLIFSRSKFVETEKDSLSLWLKRQGLAFILILLIAVSANIYFSVKNIGDFAAVDEPLWTFDRIPGYWKNLLEGDFDNTAISDKPGITVAMISGIGLVQVDPSDYESKDAQPPLQDITEMNKALRLPLAIFCAISLFIFYFFLERLLGKKIAILSTSLIALSPPLIGMQRIINPDGLLWVFAPLALLSYFAFLKKRTKAMLLLTGIMLGFSLLTKYVSNILIVFLLGLIFVEAALSKVKVLTKEEVRNHISKALVDFGSVIVIALSVFYVFYPATWQKPWKLFYATLGSQAFAPVAIPFLSLIALLLFDTFVLKNKLASMLIEFLKNKKIIITRIIAFIFLLPIAFVLIDTYLGMRPFDFQEILASPKTSALSTAFWGIFTANFYPLIFTSLPIALLGILYATYSLIRKNNLSSQTERISIYLIIFIILYHLATTISGVSSTIRYQIMLFPFWEILAAIGLFEATKRIGRKYTFITVLFLLFFSGLWVLTTVSPHYLGYASSLLPKNYIVDVKDMGDGSYEAAQYLNSLPGAKNLFVWTDKKGVCNFFVGRCDSFSGSEEFQKNKIDYFVISSGRKSRTLNVFRSRTSNPYDFSKIYSSTNFIHQLIIGGRPANYIRILKADDYLKQQTTH